MHFEYLTPYPRLVWFLSQTVYAKFCMNFRKLKEIFRKPSPKTHQYLYVPWSKQTARGEINWKMNEETTNLEPNYKNLTKKDYGKPKTTQHMASSYSCYKSKRFFFLYFWGARRQHVDSNPTVGAINFRNRLFSI